MQDNKQGYEAAVQLLRDNPEWFPVVAAALEEAQTIKSNRFAGAWILERAKRHGVQWIPNFRKLVSYGILQKDGESSRGGRRAYYSMPDIEGVEKALKEFGFPKSAAPYTAHEITDLGISKRKTILVPFYANLASCGSPDMSEGHVDDYLEVSTESAKPGNQYYLVRAVGDSMNQAGINNDDLVLVRVQDYANIGDRVVACTDGGVTIKEFHRQGNSVLLMPRSDNSAHKPLLLDNIQIQGVVVTTMPK
jgi:SOS-response transcriptional repressor LexA